MRNFLHCLSAVLMVFAAICSAQNAAPTFSITITGPQVVQVGAPVNIEISVKNVSGHVIAFDGDSLVYGERNFNLDVLDSQGNQPPETQYLKAVRGEYQGPGDTHIVLAGKLTQHNLRPGEILKASANLSGLFELGPGTYSVRVSRPDFRMGHERFAPADPDIEKKQAGETSPPNPPIVLKPKAVATSNTIRVAIVPQRDFFLSASGQKLEAARDQSSAGPSAYLPR